MVGVGKHLGKTGCQAVDHHDVGDPLLVGAKRERFADHLVEINHRARRVTLPRERQQVANDLRGPLGLAQDRPDSPLGDAIQ